MKKGAQVDNSVVWVEVETSKGSGRYERAHGLRKSHAKLIKGLSEGERQARDDIIAGYYFLIKGFGLEALGIRTVNYGAVGRGEVCDKKIERMLSRIARIHEWEFKCQDLGKLHWVEAVRAIEGVDCEAVTARDHAKDIGVSHVTVSNWYREALGVYVELFF